VIGLEETKPADGRGRVEGDERVSGDTGVSTGAKEGEAANNLERDLLEGETLGHGEVKGAG